MPRILIIGVGCKSCSVHFLYYLSTFSFHFVTPLLYSNFSLYFISSLAYPLSLSNSSPLLSLHFLFLLFSLHFLFYFLTPLSQSTFSVHFFTTSFHILLHFLSHFFIDLSTHFLSLFFLTLLSHQFITLSSQTILSLPYLKPLSSQPSHFTTISNT